jgi:molybdate transport system substrate-binding protein
MILKVIDLHHVVMACSVRIRLNKITSTNSPKIIMAQHFIFHRGIISILVFLVSGLCLAETPIIAVASNLTSPMTEIAEAYNKETGESVRLSYGSSGNLSRQIVQGAPYEIFITAGREHIDFLLAQKAPVTMSSEYIYGAIGFYIPANSQIVDTTSLKSVTNALIFKNYQKLAIANPEHAPYGVAALQALQNAGVWAMEKNNLILAESVSQLLPYLLSGNVDLAVIPYSFVLPNDLENKGRYIPVPESWYERISQYIVELENVSEAGIRFRDFLFSDAARQILERYGYSFIRTE